MVTLCLCGLLLLQEDDLLLELCLVYGVSGLLLLGCCLWGEQLWVLWWSGISVPAGVPVCAGVSWVTCTSVSLV